MMTNIIPVITVDGPSGVGKGTLCQALANDLKWHLLDSGAIYRVLALDCVEKQIAFDDEALITQSALNLPLHFSIEMSKVKTYLEHVDVSDKIRTEEIGNLASKVAALPSVRVALLARQRDFQQAPGLVADGRDMGTVVFPNATVKIFLDASAEARAERRMKQLQSKGICAKFGEILQDITERDERDRNRTVSPLKPADDALIIDTTSISINDVYQQVMDRVKEQISIA